MSQHGLRKASKQGNVYGALKLTGNGETVAGVLPRAGRGELKRLRERRLEFAMMDPSVLEYMNGKVMRRLLLEAFAKIRELDGKNDPSSATAATKRPDCNRDAMPPFDEAHG